MDNVVAAAANVAAAPTQGYCVKCKEKRDIQNAQEVEMPTKGAPRRALTGTCGVCGTKMFRILGKKVV